MTPDLVSDFRGKHRIPEEFLLKAMIFPHHVNRT
jgi:hypothetical protein